MNKLIFRVLVLVSLAMVIRPFCQSNGEVIAHGIQSPEFKLPNTIPIVLREGTPNLVISNITTSSIAGSYNGFLYDLKMNGKNKNNANDIKIDIIKQSDKKFCFSLRSFKIGKIPGL